MDLIKIAAGQIDVAARVIAEQGAELDRLRAIEARAQWMSRDPREAIAPAEAARYILGEDR